MLFYKVFKSSLCALDVKVFLNVHGRPARQHNLHTVRMYVNKREAKGESRNNRGNMEAIPDVQAQQHSCAVMSVVLPCTRRYCTYPLWQSHTRGDKRGGLEVIVLRAKS